MNAKEVLDSVYQKKYSETKPGEFYPHPYPEWVLEAMKEYAKLYAIECCEAQRIICYEEAETHPPYSSIVKGTILNAPLPDCLNETK